MFDDRHIQLLAEQNIFGFGLGLADEHALHECCHASILKIMNCQPREISTVISHKITDMPDQVARDYHEILTCATELRAALLLGWRPLDIEEVLGDNTYSERISESYAIARIKSLLWTERNYRRARIAIQFAEDISGSITDHSMRE